MLVEISEFEMNSANPKRYHFVEFILGNEGDPDATASICMNVLHRSLDQLIFFISKIKYRKINLYGYTMRPLTDEERAALPTDAEAISFSDILVLRRKMTEEIEEQRRKEIEEEMQETFPEDDEAFFNPSGEEDFEDTPSSQEDDEEDYGGAVIRNCIRKWLRTTSFSDFCGEITKRVKGQPNVKLLVANVYDYLKNIANNQPHHSNTLLAAPSGTGKTETYRAVKAYFAKAIPELVIYQYDMTSLTEEGFKGDGTRAVVRPLFEHFTHNGIGIAFLDEIDKKLIPSITSAGENTNAAVQHQILTLVEGREIADRNDNRQINTANTLFIGLGAFDSCRKKEGEAPKTIGFGACNKQFDHYDDITVEKMLQIGGTNELIGRFPNIINFHKLSDETVDSILDAKIEDYSKELGCGIELTGSMRKLLHEKANGTMGCRELERAIRSALAPARLELYEKNVKLGRYLIRLNSETEFEINEKGHS